MTYQIIGSMILCCLSLMGCTVEHKCPTVTNVEYVPHMDNSFIEVRPKRDAYYIWFDDDSIQVIYKEVDNGTQVPRLWKKVLPEGRAQDR